LKHAGADKQVVPYQKYSATILIVLSHSHKRVIENTPIGFHIEFIKYYYAKQQRKLNKFSLYENLIRNIT